MKLATVNDSGFVLTNQDGDNWTIHSFSIAPSNPSFYGMLDSAFATPARYVQEMFVRLCMLEEPGREGPKFVFNPLFETNRLSILLVLGALRKVAASPGIVVLVDKTGLPAGYLFPAGLKSADSRFLALLSAVDGETDAELLHRAFFTETTCAMVKYLCLTRVGHNGFSYEENKGVYRWIANRAIAILRGRVANRPMGEYALVEATERRDAIPFTAIMPYHAGDVLFFAIAFNNTDTPFSRIVVSRAYIDIVSSNAPSLRALPIDASPINRDENFRQGNITPDPVYFETFRDTLPEDSFYYYCRPSRNYNATDVHLVDHFAFALGRRSCTDAGLLFSSKLSPDLFRPDIPAAPIRVLLHFDGGWPLKIYPKELQEKLIDLLLAEGYAVTILAGAKYEHPQCRVTTFQSYAQFTELVRAHHILVGMDSFPVHYTAHVLGLPTLCLFSSTKPANSNAPRAVNYADLEVGLSCRPCYAVVNCPLNGKPDCKNFVAPERVAREIASMLDRVGREAPERKAASSRLPSDEICTPPAQGKPGAGIKHIGMDHLEAKVLLAGILLPFFRYSSRLYREFAAAVRREGFPAAMQRAGRFILKRSRARAG